MKNPQHHMASIFSGRHYRLLWQKASVPVDAASLAFFRITFGGVMLYSTLRFLGKGWVHQFYIKPHFFFKYYGFYWVQTLPGNWMYLPWFGMVLSLLFIIAGKFYRTASISFFLLFSYTELLDVTNYLNHYYLVTWLSFIMIFLPMNAAFSLDAAKWKQPATVPGWMLMVLRLQVGMVYFFAGIAKIKYDWLINAQPMKIWLSSCENIPLVGRLLAMKITAYLFSWSGMLFDTTAPFLLLSKKTRRFEYALVVIFHSLTMLLFYIGIFPLVMIVAALVFFTPAFHRRLLEKYFFFLNKKGGMIKRPFAFFGKNELVAGFWITCFAWQVAIPFRYLLYKGNVLWTEQGFRYSWNVMLMEKDGYVEFYIKDLQSGKSYIEYPKKYLTALQEKMMSTQPDMVLKYAHFLGNKYAKKLAHPVAVYVDSYVALNGRAGQSFINPATDMMKEKDGFSEKNWILPLANSTPE